MISHACPVIVLDDDREELWHISHGLAYCGLPVMSHLVIEGQLERVPDKPHSGVRILFTDLHILGPTQTKPEVYVGALIKFIKALVHPSSYLIVFWSNYSEDSEEAWNLLKQRLPVALHPFAFRVLPKELAENAADEDEGVAKPARDELLKSIEAIFKEYPQLQALMDWEASVSQAAAETTNELLRILPKGNAKIENPAHVRNVLARMAQEALGYPYAHQAPVRGLTQALIPIVQDFLERNADPSQERLCAFLDIQNAKQIKLPHTDLNPLLNDFFIHSESDGSVPLDRGAVVRFTMDYLEQGLSQDIGLMDQAGDWRESVCREFYIGWKNDKDRDIGKQTKQALISKNVYAVELSALCDHAQDKQRTQRFLFALFVPSVPNSHFLNGEMQAAHGAIYVTPEITLENVRGRLLISCRIFLAKPYQTAVAGACVTRLRKDVVDELSHHYATHMRRPGIIQFS